MFSVLKMIKKGAIALGAFALPLVLTIVIKLIPGLDVMTVGDVILGVIDKLIPNITSLTIGTATIMLINYLKNKK